jgi:hypothetical protein
MNDPGNSVKSHTGRRYIGCIPCAAVRYFIRESRVTEAWVGDHKSLLGDSRF